MCWRYRTIEEWEKIEKVALRYGIYLGDRQLSLIRVDECRTLSM